MTKLTTKAFAVLSNLDVYKEACKQADTKKKARITMVQYAPVDARVPQVKEGRPSMGTLHMQRKARPVKAEPSIASKLLSMELEEKAYLQWVEAHSTRRELEESWANQFSDETMRLAEEGLAQASALLAEAVQGLRTHRYPTPMRTWVDEVYPKVRK